MTDTTNAEVTAVVPAELKSTDTSTKVTEGNLAPKPDAAKVETTAVAKVEPIKPPEGESDAPDADSPQKGEKRLPRWMKERLERERQVTEARTREAVTREFLDRQPGKPAPAIQDEPTEKTLQDFDFDQGKYTDYLVDLKLTRREEKQRIESEHRKQAESQESFKAKVDAFEEKAGDGAWDDIISSPLNTKPEFKALTELFMGDEHDLEIAHHLATNLDEAKRINALTKLQQVREIAKLADRFEGTTEEKPVTAPKKTTSAPKPVTTISGAGKPSVDITDPGMSTADRIKAWKAGGR